MVVPARRAPSVVEPPEFDVLLARFENEVAVPVVAGDGRKWCQTVLASLKELGEGFDHRLAENCETLKETLKTELELADRVDKLFAKEEDLSRSMLDLERRTVALDREAERAKGGAEPTKPLEELREQWLAWIVSCRALTKEIQTWFLEANYRDAGAGD